MADPLSGDALIETVRALADDIGPRPAGHEEEEQAREYLRGRLDETAITDVETLRFRTTDTWGWLTIPPVILSAIAGFLPRRGLLWRLLSALVAAVGAIELGRAYTTGSQWLTPLHVKHPGGTILAKIKPGSKVKRRVVLIGHVDSNKHRATFSPMLKRALIPTATASTVATWMQVVLALLPNWRVVRWVRRAVQLFVVGGLATLLNDEREGYIDGANDNASAVACVLGIGTQATQTPLENTEVWLAFTGSEETGLQGLEAVLDRYENELRNALFIDYEMVGAGNIHYCTRHSGFTAFSAYYPDAELERIAAEVARKNADLRVTGRDFIMKEEVDLLWRRGYRGICIAGQGEDGWLVNWHQYNDNSSNIHRQPLERAARFGWAMMQAIDGQA